MEKFVSAAKANRNFSALLRGVRAGQGYLVTSHGKPVARLVPAQGHEIQARRAWTDLIARLEQQPVANAGRWSRDELYEDGA
ncbi:MAG TPA: type II toxin-antitoxin system prevent-host-death family antitoxin [Methylocystis sp.]|nr:type II toxin-antitoxin system prevent-host-death family antitoxin [Methylocystis sp.]